MPKLNVDKLERKFATLTKSRDSIQNLSHWIIQHKLFYLQIVQEWLNALKRSDEANLITVFYVANDVIQHCRKKGAPEYREAFSAILEQALALEKMKIIKDDVIRMIAIWHERGIYSENFSNQLKAILLGTASKEDLSDDSEDLEDSEIISSYQVHDLIDSFETLRAVKKVANEKKIVMKSLKEPEEPNFDNLIVRLDGHKIYEQFDTFSKAVEDYINTTNNVISARKKVLKSLKYSNVFYSTQNNEVKKVAQAYKLYEKRLKTMEEKLTEKKSELKFDEPSPEQYESPYTFDGDFTFSSKSSVSGLSSADIEETSNMSGYTPKVFQSPTTATTTQMEIDDSTEHKEPEFSPPDSFIENEDPILSRSEDISTPQTEGTNMIHIQGTNTPRLEDTNTPRMEDTNTPRMEDTNTPRTDSTNTPHTDSTNTPRTDSTNTPQIEGTTTPQSEGTVSPQIRGTPQNEDSSSVKDKHDNLPQSVTVQAAVQSTELLHSTVSAMEESKVELFESAVQKPVVPDKAGYVDDVDVLLEEGYASKLSKKKMSIKRKIDLLVQADRLKSQKLCNDRSPSEDVSKSGQETSSGTVSRDDDPELSKKIEPRNESETLPAMNRASVDDRLSEFRMGTFSDMSKNVTLIDTALKSLNQTIEPPMVIPTLPLAENSSYTNPSESGIPIIGTGIDIEAIMAIPKLLSSMSNLSKVEPILLPDIEEIPAIQTEASFQVNSSDSQIAEKIPNLNKIEINMTLLEKILGNERLRSTFGDDKSSIKQKSETFLTKSIEESQTNVCSIPLLNTNESDTALHNTDKNSVPELFDKDKLNLASKTMNNGFEKIPIVLDHSDTSDSLKESVVKSSDLLENSNVINNSLVSDVSAPSKNLHEISPISKCHSTEDLSVKAVNVDKEDNVVNLKNLPSESVKVNPSESPNTEENKVNYRHSKLLQSVKILTEYLSKPKRPKNGNELVENTSYTKSSVPVMPLNSLFTVIACMLPKQPLTDAKVKSEDDSRTKCDELLQDTHPTMPLSSSFMNTNMAAHLQQVMSSSPKTAQQTQNIISDEQSVHPFSSTNQSSELGQDIAPPKSLNSFFNTDMAARLQQMSDPQEMQQQAPPVEHSGPVSDATRLSSQTLATEMRDGYMQSSYDHCNLEVMDMDVDDSND